MAEPWILKIESIKDQTASVKTPDGQIWRIPVSAIQGIPAVGQDIKCLAFAPGTDSADTNVLARSILNELLGPNT